ncbi:MAG: hypothetical protein ACREV6_24425 [Clostridium sp.]|uniref:hypothetical protein n=1 Tax=Clostridium sp. TaxID=1506 RepID=UPI003D6D683D
MNSKQDDFLDIISELDDTELNSLMDNMKTNKTLNEASKASLDKIKTITYNKINKDTNKKILQINSKKKRFFSPKKIVATAAVLILLILPFSSNVIADIKGLFKYIPGNNQVTEIKSNGEVFILKKPVKVTTKNGYLEVTSLVIDNDKNLVSIAARGEENEFKTYLPKIKANIKLKNQQIIELNYGSYGGGSDPDKWHWDMDFSSIDKLKEPLDYEEGDLVEIVLEFEDKSNITVPIKLEKAKSYEAYKEIGPTCVKNDLSITAVPLWYDDKLNINLLPSCTNQNIFANYNPEYSYFGSINEPITLIDKDNNKHQKIANDHTEPFELNFNVKEKENNSYKLNIPYVKTTYNHKATHKIVLPKVGEKINFNNEAINLGEFKLKFLSAERKVENEVIIDIDTGYDDNKIESLWSVDLFSHNGSIFRKNDYDGYQTYYFDNSNKRPLPPLKQWVIKLNHPNSSDLTLTIGSFSTIKKGPWIIDIPGEAIKR